MQQLPEQYMSFLYAQLSKLTADIATVSSERDSLKLLYSESMETIKILDEENKRFKSLLRETDPGNNSMRIVNAESPGEHDGIRHR